MVCKIRKNGAKIQKEADKSTGRQVINYLETIS